MMVSFVPTSAMWDFKYGFALYDSKGDAFLAENGHWEDIRSIEEIRWWTNVEEILEYWLAESVRDGEHGLNPFIGMSSHELLATKIDFVRLKNYEVEARPDYADMTPLGETG